MVGVDVRGDQPAQALRAQMSEGVANGRHRVFLVHPAIQEICLLAVWEKEDVDQPVLERDGQPQLEDTRRNLAQRELDGHSGIVIDAANMGFDREPLGSGGAMSEVQMTPDQIVEALPNFLIPEKAGETKATIQFDLSGDGGGKWWVRIHDGKAESGKGDPGEPANLTLLADAHDWVKIMTGRWTASPPSCRAS